MKNLFFLIFVLISLSQKIFSQRIFPAPLNFLPQHYEAGTQNWQIIQDKRGIIYVANNEGVLEFDGTTWRKILTSNKTLVRSFAADSAGNIYVGAIGEIGFLETDLRGNISFQSLNYLLGKENQDFSDVWKTYALKNDIFFQSFEKIFRYSVRENKIIQIFLPEKTKFHRSFIVDTSYFVKEVDNLLFELRNNQLFPIESSRFLENDRIYAMLPFEKNIFLTVWRENGIYFFDKTSQKFYKNKKFEKLDNLLIKHQIYFGGILPDKKIGFGTLLNGLIITDFDGNILSQINKNEGISENNIYNFCVDFSKNLWLATENGVCYVEISSPLKIFTEKDGLSSFVNILQKFKNILYLGTNSEIYYLENQVIKEISDFKQQNFSMIKFYSQKYKEEKLLVGGNDGVFEIVNKKIFLMKKGIVVVKLLQSKTYPELLFAGLNDGLYVFEYQGNSRWKDLGRVENIKFQVRSLGEEVGKNLWMGTNHRGVIQISLGKNFDIKRLKSTFYDTLSGLPTMNYVQPFYFRGKMLFTTGTGIFTFDSLQKRFIPETRLGERFTKGIGIYLFNFDKNDNIVLRATDLKKMWIERGKLLKNNELEWQIHPFERLSDRAEIADEGFLQDSNSLWIASSDGLFQYQTFDTKNYSQNFQCLIRKVKLSNDSIIYNGGFNSTTYFIKHIDYQCNGLIFEFSAPFFESPSEIEYSYFLENYDSRFSNWTKDNKKEYTNLFEGNYTFHVKARNVYGTESFESVYHFKIKPPFYRNWWAYSLYFVAFLGSIFGIVKLNSYRLIREKERLENIVQERTAEINQQKEEIRTQAENLQVINEELVVLNDQLGFQKKDLETKNSEITQSIRYAQRIQDAILPPCEIMCEYFNEFFIFYRPRNIVSGDFYYIKEVHEKFYVVALADCTGHGVPGAFMSMLGVALLNEVVRRKDITTTSEALNELRNQVKIALRQTGKRNEQKDGMDMILCTVDKNSMKLQFSGANKTLILIRNNELFEFKGDKMPVGIHIRERDFSYQDIDIQENDSLYLYSDGYEDQFGGEEGKKFLSRNLRDLLLSISQHNFVTQKEILEKIFLEWRGDFDQIDDVSVMGIKI